MKVLLFRMGEAPDGDDIVMCMCVCVCVCVCVCMCVQLHARMCVVIYKHSMNSFILFFFCF